MSTDYRVRLESFEGPLDLLLHLIRRAEVDITDIPIATIADQYMGYLSAIDRVDIDLAGEFLVMAATLMEIKSRMLTPRQADGELGAEASSPAAEGVDPRAELVQQLLAYKRFRDAASELETRKLDWDRRFPAGGAGVDDEELRAAIDSQRGELDLEDLSLLDLVEAFSKIVATVNFDRLGEHTVTYDDTPIELHAEDLLDRLKHDAGTGDGAMLLSAVFAGRRRGEMIGLFLATLELVRRRAISLKQETPGGEILLRLRPSDEAANSVEPPTVEVASNSEVASDPLQTT